jgi:hypothetical protein
MTKKDYIELAKLIRNEREYFADWQKHGIGTIQVPLDHFVNGLCYILKSDNPRFDKERFLEACNPEIYRIFKP